MVLRGRLPLGTAADLRDPFSSRGTGNVPQGSFPRESCFVFCFLGQIFRSIFKVGNGRVNVIYLPLLNLIRRPFHL